MAKEPRPKGYPKLKNYKPSQFMLPTSHYDKKKADRAVTFIENLCHTKGKWAGTPFWLLPWQEQLIRDIFGIVKPDGNRQFRTAFVEICKKVGKSELAAAIALYLLYADNEPSAEVYGAAADRQQASIVFDVAKQMVEMSPALMKRSKLMGATKRIVNYGNAGYYQVLSAEVGGKHGFSVSGLVFDEIHTQPNRQLYDVLTKGSSDARQNPLHFIITTAGNDRHSIAYELHTKAVDILEGRRVDPTFYPVVYGLKDDEDWEDEANWYKVNPSLGYTVDVERLRDAYREAKQNPADEITFKWLRCNMWVSSTVAWIPDAIYMRGNEPINMASLEGRDCYAGLDLSSTGDITALVLIFPPRDEDEKFVLLPYFWIPEETIPRRVKANSVPYDIWEKQGYIMSTEGNVIHYDFIEKFIMDLSEKYHILEIAVDRWNATHVIQNLEDNGLTMVPFGQGFASMSAPTKEFYRLLMEGKIIHGGHPVMRWMAGNVVVDTDPAGNIKVTKSKSKEKIDGIVAAIMALDRAVRHESEGRSVYDTRGIILI
ncbi:terminase large subunit [Phocaeicola sartorii]|uniref:terminase large subunit n=1 Tax=Phocaeicola sartorii TaxID=671267 RepID=UPI0025A996CB|nr:terminase TerL endonuclease subunit [Phocaeicola sartorii]